MRKEEIIKNCLKEIIEKIDSGNSHIDEEEYWDILDSINALINTKHKLSKHQAAKYLGMSRATFDKKVREGKLPPGIKEQGFTEKFWVKADLIKYKNEN